MLGHLRSGVARCGRIALGAFRSGDPAVVDAHDAIGKLQRAVIVRHGQHGAFGILRDL